jgi:TRAP-type mannitol/chloroaromatic compound transport system permease small subunit
MQRKLFLIDNISTWAGKLFAWCIVILTLVTVYDVLARYLFRAPVAWAYDLEYIFYGSLFMMAGAYTLSRNGHVRGDVLYGFFPPRVQAGLDLVLYFAFFLPGIVALAYAGIDFAKLAWVTGERSGVVTEGAPLYPFKSLIPIAGALVLLQGLAEIARCIICLKTGAWPKRAHDVEEVDVEEFKKMLHVGEAPAPEGVRFTEGAPPDLRNSDDGAARKGESK